MGAFEIGGGEGGTCSHPRVVGVGPHWGLRLAPAAFVFAFLLGGVNAAWALDGSRPSSMEKIPIKLFKSAQQALRMGIEELRAGDSKSSVEALKYAAEGGESLAQWKLGRMYADGDGVPRDDLKAYEYFDQVIRNYNEDEPDRPDISAVSKAVVAIGIYSLNGIANSPIQPDPDRAFEMFQYAATNFGDPDAQYNLARMYMDGVGGLPKNNMRAARWLVLAADKHHHPAQAVLGHLLFVGEGVPRQRGRGLMWLTVAKNAARGPKDEWMSDLYNKDFAAAGEDDKQIAALYLRDFAKGEDTQPAMVARAPMPMPPPGMPIAPRPFVVGPPPGGPLVDEGPPPGELPRQ